jgi:hypothetical protein
MGNIHAYIPCSLALEPGDLGILSDAYDLAMLDLPGGEPRLVELVARQIVALAAAGERDSIALCDKALAHAGVVHFGLAGADAADAADVTAGVRAPRDPNAPARPRPRRSPAGSRAAGRPDRSPRAPHRRAG